MLGLLDEDAKMLKGFTIAFLVFFLILFLYGGIPVAGNVAAVLFGFVGLIMASVAVHKYNQYSKGNVVLQQPSMATQQQDMVAQNNALTAQNNAQWK